MGPRRRRPTGGAYGQSVAALERIRGALEEVGASLSPTSCERGCSWSTSSTNQEDVGRAHSEYFGDVLPVSSMIGIAGLAAPGYIVEIEVDALIAGDGSLANRRLLESVAPSRRLRAAFV